MTPDNRVNIPQITEAASTRDSGADSRVSRLLNGKVIRGALAGIVLSGAAAFPVLVRSNVALATGGGHHPPDNPSTPSQPDNPPSSDNPSIADNPGGQDDHRGGITESHYSQLVRGGMYAVCEDGENDNQETKVLVMNDNVQACVPISLVESLRLRP